nr:LptA/OstA family protein [Geitlerinema sp. PCC 9228]
MFKLLLRSFLSTSGWLLLGWLVVAGSWTQPMDAQPSNSPTAQTSPNTPAGNRKLTVKSDIQEADAQTGIITARGNVQIDYPAQQIYATSNQAQYFTRERRIVLTGNVRVLQNGNTIRGETVTYLIDEGLFVARPASNEQVESVYVVPESTNNNPGSSGTDAPALPTTPSESEASANGNTDDTRDNNPPSLPSMPSESESEESEESVR